MFFSDYLAQPMLHVLKMLLQKKLNAKFSKTWRLWWTLPKLNGGSKFFPQMSPVYPQNKYIQNYKIMLMLKFYKQIKSSINNTIY